MVKSEIGAANRIPDSDFMVRSHIYTYFSHRSLFTSDSLITSRLPATVMIKVSTNCKLVFDSGTLMLHSTFPTAAPRQTDYTT